MRSLMLAACAAALVLVPVRAAQNAAHADSPRVTISVDHPTQVGDTVLKPGDYRFQCRHLADKTFLVVSRADSGKEVVRVPCREEALPQKIADSELRVVVQPDGSSALQSIRIKGETLAHRIVAN
jgi:hypothetical protein